ncbi:MAG: cupin domain-containing protein [Bacteroidetes bacterium]|nr:MAG: cupin domain-containing protein [Bacteroidota bacterium]
MNKIDKLVAHYGLLPHPEGGFYKETYRSPTGMLPAGFPSHRPYATAIYFLLTAQHFSAFHRIASDEVWHFYEGDGLHVHMIAPNGDYSLLQLGPDAAAGQVYQAVVPAGYWFASGVAVGGHYAFVGCTVAPGFCFEDFELANRQQLIESYPQHAALIGQFTR